ncbi:protein BREAKING OF ASYMMETRY IN THE STOMATAL LINEAGE [Pyrus x bretschneideri]|uniref:protein BREAKING OF ASYMMETRY IN THE STOMATAL LINEAGE n=1 Tax=Pyrus x bretschneideri TaxID=225117 RepID=UPI002030A933|nr:protein BREAKING OF ASYMMETRY IN THE STOMATAL LINEAGE [Pyrus x bretschneideri]
MCSTPWTMTRLVRWRVKDWASCFLACRFLLDDEPADKCCPATPQLPIRNMAFDMLGESRSNETGKKMSRQKNCDRERRLRHSTKQAKDTSCRPRFSDEEYIVFCFKEDGAFEVVKNGKLEASNTIDCASRNSPRPANRKLSHGQDTRAVERRSNEKRLTEKAYDIYPTNDGKCIIFDQKHEEEEENRSGQEPPPSRDVKDRSTVSVESSDSSQSDGSTGSFAFPVLGREWNGSPVQMPISEAMDLRKHKARCIGFRFQCRRF